ncbi:MAG TPA: rhodanese-like domain-containing protein [Candidatus Competibacteraceae bacterium]|nr:rhodanese-like domain-containing protein [Candidatus Competibacteraceae bacterium]MCP5133762.1 rhodanese-like domain-containing protein [Gammaproteobacteria bacterium]HPF58049.1 rhodanese-like domain-containing protein [Candidatus Competibacteraceae bacterium]HRY19012.1 rhodanese-like domain-containing protein [Candidatus Competibacteraceae bacterium]
MSDFTEFALQNWLLFAAAFAILGMLLGSEILRRMRGITAVNATEALRLINDKEAWIVDIRDAAEYKSGHIPQARHIPSATLKGRVDELIKAGDKPVIVYCRSGAAAQSACALLKKNGMVNVYSLSGGLSAWQEASLPISRKKA